ncbi:MAG: hypothetical protein ACLUKN_09735 [Bacilli bacterium]
MEDNQLDSRKSNFTMAVDIDKSRKLFAAWLDLSTAEFYCAEFDNPNDFFLYSRLATPKKSYCRILRKSGLRTIP